MSDKAKAPDLVLLAVSAAQARSRAQKARTLRALQDGLAWWRELALEPGRCPTCGYKRRVKRDLLRPDDAHPGVQVDGQGLPPCR